jgi:hypothetical protein
MIEGTTYRPCIIFAFRRLFSFTVMTHSFIGGRDPPHTHAQACLELPPPDSQPSRSCTSEGHVAHDECTANSTHHPRTSGERDTPSLLSPLGIPSRVQTRRANPNTPSSVDPPQPAAPP